MPNEAELKTYQTFADWLDEQEPVLGDDGFFHYPDDNPLAELRSLAGSED